MGKKTVAGVLLLSLVGLGAITVHIRKDQVSDAKIRRCAEKIAKEMIQVLETAESFDEYRARMTDYDPNLDGRCDGLTTEERKIVAQRIQDLTAASMIEAGLRWATAPRPSD